MRRRSTVTMGGRTGTGQGTWRGREIRRLRRRTREFGAAAAVVGEEVSAVEDERRGGRQHGDNTAVRAPSLTGRLLMRSSPSSSFSSSPSP
ncbi:Os05g0381800 [Oryza sativa Japonica Group]|uniref:Os05g0381800 protein n=1 Tax=Oryza sativa subsp. japonica TaxID=39947 RepID=A0A0P0WLP9_ORYSJ|nr:Os05g0381800 [Oryza sativa Japonica Group]